MTSTPDQVPRLVVLTDRFQLRAERDLVPTIAECARAGLRMVVVREHDLEPDCRRRLVARLAAIGDLCVVSSRIVDPTAAGVHLAAHQPPGRGWWGRSCHTVDEVSVAASQGASWVTLSPFAESSSKPGYGPVLPPGACAGHDVPVLALGGIRLGNAARARESGAHGVAVMGAVMRSHDPARMVADLVAEVA